MTSKVKYLVNEIYFDRWSANMAYILGFIYADGCINIQKNRYKDKIYYQYRLAFGLKDDDVEILEFIRNELSPNRPIGYNYSKRTLFISNEYLCNSLQNLGVMPRKTGKERLPNIPEKYKFDFLRGLFDGDGCVHIGSYLDNRDNKYYKHYHMSIASGSELFLQEIKENLCMNLGYIRKHTNDKGVCYYWKIASKKDINNLAKKMYKNNGFKLERKYKRFVEGGLL